MHKVLTAFLTTLALWLGAGPVHAQFSVQYWSRECSTSERDEEEDGINLEECEGNCKFTYRYSYTGSLGAGDLYVYLGSACDQKENRDEGRCFAALENYPLETLANIEIEPAWVVDPMSDPPTCTEGEGATDLWFLILADDSDQTVLYQDYRTVNYDTQPPDPPVDIRAGYGEGMITVRWEVADEDFPDEWAHFYVMCFPNDNEAEPTEPAPDTGTDASTDTTVDTGTDVAAEPDADGGSDAADAPESDAGDGGSDADGPDTAGADTAATDTGTDTSSDAPAAEGCPPGGFSTGDEFDGAYTCSGRLGSTARSYDLRGLTNNQPYMVSVVAVDEFGNESDIGEIVCATPQEVDDFWEVYKKAGGGDDGGFCFVATAAFGDYRHPAVVWLRAFRDEVLGPLPGGEAVVGAYYRLSPAAAGWLRGRPAARAAVRAVLWPAAGAAWAAVGVHRSPSMALLVLIGLVACFVALRAGGFGRGRR